PSPRSLFIFASHCYRAHPVLHPFPTRRSSDLELLPFREASFDFVFSRVALPYMHIPKAASEMGRVLKPGGGLWCLLHPLSRFSLRDTMISPKQILFQSYVLANTALFHLWGLQFHPPLLKSLM